MDDIDLWKGFDCFETIFLYKLLYITGNSIGLRGLLHSNIAKAIEEIGLEVSDGKDRAKWNLGVDVLKHVIK